MLQELLERIQDEPPQDYKIFVDMDGVLVDFVQGVINLIGDYSEERYESDPEYRNQMWAAVKDYPGKFWFELNPLKDAHLLWRYVAPHEPEILTATGQNGYGAGPQKREWIAKYLGIHVPVNVTTRASEKAQHAAPNHILIDDRLEAINPWISAGGIGILHTDAASTIQQLKQLGL